MRPRLLDLCCGAGGCSIGYDRAGFEVVGVDIAPQPRYPFEFHQADALTFPLDGFDAIHASPPCQAYSVATGRDRRAEHPALIGPIVERLRATAVPWIVENVPGAPVPNPVVVCGASLGCIAVDTDGSPLVLRRHRLFGSNVLLLVPPCACGLYRDRRVRVAGVYGHGGTDRAAGTYPRGGYTPKVAVRRDLIGTYNMTQAELSLAIPPAYTELLGGQLMLYVEPAPC